MVLYIFKNPCILCVLIFSLTKCGMLLSMSGKLCLRHFFRIHALLYKCLVHVCSVYHVCVQFGINFQFGKLLAHYHESNCNTILIVVM